MKTFSRVLLIGSLLPACDGLLGISAPRARPPAPEAGAAGTSAGEAGSADERGGSESGGRGGTGGQGAAAGAGGAGGAAGHGGDGGNDSGGAGAAGDGGELQAGAGGAAPCSSTERRCGGELGLTPEVCDEQAGWVADADECEFDCWEGTCVECVGEERQCLGDRPRRCEEGRWQDEVRCDHLCSAGACRQTPPSCGAELRCGAEVSCCKSFEVPGGTFLRGFDDVEFNDDDYPATIRGFFLDKFEVTVGRMRAFVAAYPNLLGSGYLHAGRGRAPHIHEDAGWQERYPLPPSAEALVQTFREPVFCRGATWPEGGGPENDALPMNCVTFPVAYAFCIWDGGRLPTEAEWNFAAAGGDESRRYPWSTVEEDGPPTSEHAFFDQDAGGPMEVGMLPRGDGRYFQSDLGGNVSEWTLDFLAAEYPMPCNDCLQATPMELRAVRGASYADYVESLPVPTRFGVLTEGARDWIGFRCARDLP